MSSTHAYFAFYRHVGLFNQWKGAKIVWFNAGAFNSVFRSKNCRVWGDASFYFNFKDFFLPGSTISIPDIGKWCFSQFKFRFACVFSPFRASEQVGSVTIRSRFNTRSFQLQKIRLFLQLFALQSPLFCLQILIRCSHKQPVWHWQARHQPRVNTISKLSKLL